MAAARRRRRDGGKREDVDAGDEAGEVVPDELEDRVRRGARQILELALHKEPGAYLGRGPYERADGYDGYESGSTSCRRPSSRRQLNACG